MEDLPGRTLAVAGGPIEAAREVALAADSLGIGERVTFAGLLPPAEVGAFLRAGRVGVCPLPAGRDSVSDAFTSPMKLLQMMALGLPVVATDVPPVRAILEGGVEGLLAPPNDPRALAAAIARLLDDPALASRLGAAARRRASAFAWRRRAEMFERFVRSLEPTDASAREGARLRPTKRSGVDSGDAPWQIADVEQAPARFPDRAGGV